MKKTLIALAALAATSAMAQVTIYGIIDTNYKQQTTTQTAAGVSVDTKDNGVGAGSLSTPRWGLKGSEDLGGGMKANFTMESALAPDTGATQAAAWGRTMKVGLSGGFGAFDLGVDYSPFVLLYAFTDPNALVGGTNQLWAQGASIFPTDALWYTTPNMGGFTGKLMYANSEGGSTGATTAGRNTGLSATYAAGPLYISYAYDAIDNQSAANVNSTNSAQAIGATYNFGAAKLFANYGTSKAVADTTADTNTFNTETNVGVTVPMGAVTLIAAAGRNTRTRTVAGVETATTGTIAAGTFTGTGSGTDYSLGITYALSARTHAYGKVASNGNYNFTDTTAANKVGLNLTVVGLRHIF